MKDNLNLEHLSADELITINGGSAPSKKTSFAYDVAYWVGRIGDGIIDLLVDAAHNPIRPSQYR